MEIRHSRLLLVVVLGVVMASCSSTAQVEVPGVVGQSVDDAVAALENVGLTPVVRESAGEGDGWRVVDQDPTALADAVDEGSEVVLEVESVLSAAADACAIPGGADDGGASLILDLGGTDLGSGELIDRHLECVLNQLERPEAVWASIMSTRALDGRQTADWDGIEASWTYHPDTGLDLILELDD